MVNCVLDTASTLPPITGLGVSFRFAKKKVSRVGQKLTKFHLVKTPGKITILPVVIDSL